MNARASRTRLTWFGLAARAVVAGVVAIGVTAATGIGRSSGATTPTEAVAIQGGGSWAPYQQLVPWQNDLASAAQYVNLGYTPHGTLLGRGDFIRTLQGKQQGSGAIDFVLSGVPFSASELTQVPGGAGGIIDAPVHVASLTALLNPPDLGSVNIICDPDDPTTWPANVTDPSQCIQKTPYNGPIRIPHDNLVAMLLRYPGTTNPPLSSWNNPSVLAAFGVTSINEPAAFGPAAIVRSDGDEVNYYLQQYAKVAAPSVWAGNIAKNPSLWEPIRERLARLPASRDGVDQQSGQLLFGVDPATGNAQFNAGVIAPVPASARDALIASYRLSQLKFVEVQNAAGEWVAPTSKAITAAAAAGLDQPLYALTHNVTGAYPLVWIDHLYAPAHGLSVLKTEGLATVIRYLATVGQSAAARVGEGILPEPLVQQSLAAANQLVASNCVGSDRKIQIDSTAGPLAPASMQKLKWSTTLHCIGITPQSTTTTVATTPATLPPDTTPVTDTVPSDTGTGATDTTTPAVTPTTKAKPATTTPTTAAFQLASASRLSMPSPVAPSSPDRLLTFAIGALLYIVLRRPVTALVRRGVR